MTDQESKGAVLVLGATSAMAEHAARIHAQRGDRLVLVARSADKLAHIAADLEARGAASVRTEVMDLSEADGLDDRLEALLDGRPLLRAYLFYGVLGDQRQAEGELDVARDLMVTNYLSAALWCLAIGNILERQGHGALVAISSVAGDRGRQSNFIYGSAKAGLSTLVQGLDHRLARTAARAVAIRFGFVISPMTEGMKRTGPLWTSAEKAGALAVAAGDRARGVIYAPFFWRYIMLVIRLLPAQLFNRTRL